VEKEGNKSARRTGRWYFPAEQQTMRKLRTGIVGVCGRVAGVHLNAYRTVDSIEVVAGADLSDAGLAAIGQNWGVRTYSDLEQMLETESLDIACICVPASRHLEVAEVVAGHGVHILVEKPLAVTLRDARAILKTCESAGVKLYYGSSYRNLTAVRKAREIILEKGIGDISLCTEFAIGGFGADRFEDMGHLHYPHGGPGGHGMGLVDHGIHLIDIFSWLMDSEVTSVYGRGNLSGHRPSSEYALLNFDNGAIAQLLASGITFPASLPNEGIFSWGGHWSPDGTLSMEAGWDSHPGSFQIYGDSGSLNVFYYAEKLFQTDRTGIKQVRVEQRPMPGNFAMQMESFARSVMPDLPPEVPGQAGLRALQTLLAIYESHQTGELVRIQRD